MYNLVQRNCEIGLLSQRTLTLNSLYSHVFGLVRQKRVDFFILLLSLKFELNYFKKSDSITSIRCVYVYALIFRSINKFIFYEVNFDEEINLVIHLPAPDILLIFPTNKKLLFAKVFFWSELILKY